MVLAKFGAFGPSVQICSLSGLAIIYLAGMWWFRRSIGWQCCQFRAGTAPIANPAPARGQMGSLWVWGPHLLDANNYWLVGQSWGTLWAWGYGTRVCSDNTSSVWPICIHQLLWLYGYGLWPPDWHAIMKICECLGPDCIYCLSGRILSIAFVCITKLLGPCDSGIWCCGSWLCCIGPTQTSKQFQDLAKIRKVRLMLPNKLVITANFVVRYLCEFYGHVSNVEIVLEISKFNPFIYLPS